MTPCPRRAFLAAAVRAGAGLGCAALLPLAGCNDDAAGPPVLRVPLADLPEGGRTRHDLDGKPVELLRRGGAVTARSLLCTHQGCVVAWVDEAGAYVCPCHEGRFDADGQPVYGPPRLPLRDLPVVIEGDEAVVGS